MTASSIFGELGLQHFRTCEQMSSLLENGGLEVERNLEDFRRPYAQLTAPAWCRSRYGGTRDQVGDVGRGPERDAKSASSALDFLAQLQRVRVLPNKSHRQTTPDMCP